MNLASLQPPQHQQSKQQPSTAQRILARTGLVLAPIGALPLLSQWDTPIAQVGGILLWMVIWWLTQAVPLWLTALLPIVVSPLVGLTKTSEIVIHYARSPIFLFIGGFLLAQALEQENVHRWVVAHLLRWSRGYPRPLFLLLTGGAYLLSMWLSNTATTLALLPVLLVFRHEPYSWLLALGVAYGASLGGMATLVGTPPNAFLAGLLEEQGITLAFSDWLLLAFPVSLFLLGVWIVLALVGFARVWQVPKTVHLPDTMASIQLSRRARQVLLVFLLTVLLWIFRKSLVLGNFTIPGWSAWLPWSDYPDDATVAILAVLLLGMLGIVTTDAVRRLPWDALLLFGGGFALSYLIQEHDFGQWWRNQIENWTPEEFRTGLWAATTLILTEFASNTATSAIFAPLALSTAGIQLAVIVTLSASGAFMLPIATMPNLLVYSAGLVSWRQMIRAGLLMNCVALIINVNLVPVLFQWVMTTNNG